MKKTINTQFSQISESQVKNLTTIVNETIAFDTHQNSNKVFTAANLWNIQRNKKSVTSRRITF